MKQGDRVDLGEAAREEWVWVAKRFGLGAAAASIVVSNQPL